jgi:hypothetical protein
MDSDKTRGNSAFKNERMDGSSTKKTRWIIGDLPP